MHVYMYNFNSESNRWPYTCMHYGAKQSFIINSDMTMQQQKYLVRAHVLYWAKLNACQYSRVDRCMQPKSFLLRTSCHYYMAQDIIIADWVMY